MKTEELKALGLDQEQIDEVMKLNGQDIEAVKAKTTKLEAQLDKAKEDLKTRDDQLAELTKINPEELQAEITRLQAENADRIAENEKALKDLQVSHAIQMALTGKVHDTDLVATLFDREKLVLGDDGKVIGLEDQITTLQESKNYLFKTNEPAPEPGFSFGQPKSSTEGSTNAEISAAFGNTQGE